MLGSEGVTRAVDQTLQLHMPAKLAEFRARYTVTDQELPNIQRWYAHDVDEVEISGFPAILTVEVESTGELGNQELDRSYTYDVYEFEYVMRVYVWAMGDTAGTTALLVKRLVLAVEEILLGHKVLYSNDDGEGIKVDPRRIRHSYSDPATDGAQQILSAGYVQVFLQSQEILHSTRPVILGSPVNIVTDVVVVSADTDLVQ
jgi:hypothetical protein